MGQYYKAVFLSDNNDIIGWSDSHTGAKITEHSYINDSFVLFIQSTIFKNPTRIVWAGDYADNESPKENLESAIKSLRCLVNNKDVDHSSNADLIEHAKKILERNFSEKLNECDFACIKYALNIASDNLYSICNDEPYKYMPYGNSDIRQLHNYIINHTLKEYVFISDDESNNKDEILSWQMCGDDTYHPLPLLTAEIGTGGGGDYRGSGKEDIGVWARHLISTDNEAPEGYVERIVNF